VKLAGYVRVSTGTQVEHGFSLDEQRRSLEEYCEREGHKLVSLHADEGVSGTNGLDKRPGLAAAIDDVAERRARGILVRDIDRLARALHVQEDVMARVWDVGGSVLTASDGEIPRDDPEDPYRTFVRQVLGAAAQLNAGLTKAKLHRGRREKARRRGYVGGSRLQRRYGYTLVRDDGKYRYEPVPDEQAIIRRMQRLRARGESFRAIAHALDSSGVPAPSVRSGQDVAKTGAATWSGPTVKRILDREAKASP
jgi:DNA invertase Pin-like site-specific DNA recombinase